MVRIILSFILLSTFSLPSTVLTNPSNGQTLNYIHVPFEWLQEPDTDLYNLQVSISETFDNTIIDIYEKNIIYIEKNLLSWGGTYFWRVRTISENNDLSDWSDISFFTIGNAILDSLSIDIYNNDFIEDGLIIYHMGTNKKSVVINKFGNEIWNTEVFTFREVDKYGRLFGTVFPENRGGRITFDNEIIWQTPEQIDNHEILEIPNGNIMTFKDDFQLGPIALGDWTASFQDLGYSADGIANEFFYKGVKIIEYDKETGEEVWSWNPFEHFTKDDSDLYGGSWWAALTTPWFDWTHSNSFHFDELDSVIYISHRQLSRITKILYPSGEVIWNLGLPANYNTGDQNICNDLLFSFQHHIRMLDDGDLIFFDNGNLSQMLLGDSYPTSRVRRIRVINDSYCETIWEYDLPQELYGWAQGSVQLLGNGNYLIYTHGDGNWGNTLPSIIEVTDEKDIVWKATGTIQGVGWYRAYKIPSIYPHLFSVMFDNYKSLDDETVLEPGVIFDANNTSLSFTIYNYSGFSQPYIYILNDNNEWFEQKMDTVYIESNDSLIVNLNPIIQNNLSETNFELDVWPLFHDYSKKTITKNIYCSDCMLKNDETINPFYNNIVKSFPNPFNSSNTFYYSLEKSIKVKITIHDLLGRIVKTLFNDIQSAGNKSIQWDATNDKNEIVPAGVYIYTIQSGQYFQTKKVILLK
tara:strand:+ start:5467 stop:7545 length:2079 start_codon:yes stop_codon:yes gene_type:complete